GLDFMGFVRLFGDVSDEAPQPATADELFGRKASDSGSETVAAKSPLESDDLKMQRCIKKLTPEQQEVYRMVEQEKRAIGEIAELTRREESAVRELLGSARKELARLFFEN
ncbi:MAG: sigma factor-like helix-turn-helix DNA-binding protein, partial [Pelodictyon phaeoclathratiforme]